MDTKQEFSSAPTVNPMRRRYKLLDPKLAWEMYFILVQIRHWVGQPFCHFATGWEQGRFVLDVRMSKSGWKLFNSLLSTWEG